MAIADRIVEPFSKALARFLTTPLKGGPTPSTCSFDALRGALQPGDVLLVEGNSRVASVIKYLTQSTWSHAAVFTGPIAGATKAGEEPHVLVEAELEEGVISSPLSKYDGAHVRICRPVGLKPGEIEMLLAYMIERIGFSYDLKNVVDLARYLMPTPPVPARFRRRMIALGSGSPTRAICSTLIAQAFEAVRYPILPTIERIGSGRRSRDIYHIRHHSLYAPRDFDISPYFAVVKPTIVAGFDHHKLTWAV